MQLATNAANHADRLAKINLASPGDGERHELLSRALASFPNDSPLRSSTPPVKPCSSRRRSRPLRGVALFARRLAVGLQDRIDKISKRIQLRAHRRPLAPITRRRRITAHLLDRVPLTPNTERLRADCYPELKTKSRTAAYISTANIPAKALLIRKTSVYPVAGYYSGAAALRRRFTGRILQRCLHLR